MSKEIVDCRNQIFFDQDVSELAKKLRSPLSMISSITLINNQLQMRNFLSILEAFRNHPHLTFLRYEENFLEDGALLLAKYLKKNSTLETLILNDNRVYPNGIASMAAAIKVNQNLKVLKLENCVSDKEGVLIADALKHNSSLTELSLKRNLLWHSGWDAMANALQVNSTLKILDLSDCRHMDSDCCSSLANALKFNYGLECLNVSSFNFSFEWKNIFIHALQFNVTLLSLKMTLDFFEEQFTSKIFQNTSRLDIARLKTQLFYFLFPTINIHRIFNIIFYSNQKKISEHCEALHTSNVLEEPLKQ